MRLNSKPHRVIQIEEGGCKMPTIKWSIIVFLVLIAVVTFFEQAPNIEIKMPIKTERSK